MQKPTGREKDVQLIHQANRAAAVGRLMLGEYDSWHEFLEYDLIDLAQLPRRQLRSGRVDVKSRLSAEIKKFCSQNFRGMTATILSRMYEEIKASYGLELPLPTFEERFASVRREILRGNPAHLTVSISLWGFKLRFPEAELAKDVVEALRLSVVAQEELARYDNRTHAQAKKDEEKIGNLMRQKGFASRSTLLSCFNLMEAYLNGLAWDYLQNDPSGLSNRKKKLLEDTSSASTRDKLLKYPEIIGGSVLWNDSDPQFKSFIETIKPFRDSLVHPSPFSAPQKFGGYDKLRLFYRIDGDTAHMAVTVLIELIQRVHQHIFGIQPLPEWASTLSSDVNQLFNSR